MGRECHQCRLRRGVGHSLHPVSPLSHATTPATIQEELSAGACIGSPSVGGARYCAHSCPHAAELSLEAQSSPIWSGLLPTCLVHAWLVRGRTVARGSLD